MNANQRRDLFKYELVELLKKHNAEIKIEDVGISYRKEYNMIVEFGWSSDLFDKYGTGCIPELNLGTFIG